MPGTKSNRACRAALPSARARSRTLLFGFLIVVFAAGLTLAGYRVGMTTVGLPPEQHPSLLVERDEIGLVRARLAEHPYDLWYERLRKRAEAGATGQGPDPLKSSQCAKDLACLYVLTGDRGLAEQAAAAIARLRPSAGPAAWRCPEDVVTGAANLAVSYDLLVPYLRSQSATGERVREVVVGAGDSLWRLGEQWAEACGAAERLRYSSALGLCALAVSDGPATQGKPGPRDWYKRARMVYRDTLRRAVAPDGAFAEGPGQQYRAAALYLPFATACRHTTGDDLLSDGALKACEWSVRMRLPNGMRPSADGAGQSPSCSFGVWPDGADGELYRWDMVAGSAAADLPDSELCEALLLGGHGIGPEQPKWTPTQVLDESGDVVFRSGWGPTATYLLLRAEKGQARLAGGALEQADSTSVMVAKGDELLTLDGGFGGGRVWGETASGPAHSVVLMDGEGPPIRRVLGRVAEIDADTQLGNLLHGDGVLEAATATRKQSSGTFSRTVLLLRRSDFVIIDRVLPKGGEHSFRWQLHCNAGDGTGGRLQVVGNRAEVSRPGARLGVWLWSLGGACEVGLRVRDATHYLGSETAQQHLVLQGDAPRGHAVTFVSVLSPRARHERLARVAATQGDGWLHLTLGEGTHCVVRQDAAGMIGDSAVHSDGSALVWEEGADGTVQSAGAFGAGRLTVGSHVLTAREPGEVLTWKRGQAAAPPASPAKRSVPDGAACQARPAAPRPDRDGPGEQPARAPR